MLLNAISLSLCFLFIDARPFRSRAIQQYGRLIVFGDSFSDNGNGSWIVSKKTWPADPAYYNHAFSNGPAWADTLTSSLHIPLLDFATGGATADNSFVAGFTGANSTIAVPSAFDQVRKFLAKDSPRQDDLFVLWIGANDPLFKPEIHGSQVISLINRDIDLLYRAGAKTILVANYPLISEFPATYDDAIYRIMGESYAAELNAGLIDIEADYQAYIQIRFVDVGALFAGIIESPEDYGIESKYVNPPTACLHGSYAVEGVSDRKLCDDPEKHLFFDSYHPVSGVHDMIAALFEESLEELK